MVAELDPATEAAMGQLLEGPAIADRGPEISAIAQGVVQVLVVRIGSIEDVVE